MAIELTGLDGEKEGGRREKKESSLPPMFSSQATWYVMMPFTEFGSFSGCPDSHRKLEAHSIRGEKRGQGLASRQEAELSENIGLEGWESRRLRRSRSYIEAYTIEGHGCHGGGRRRGTRQGSHK